MDLSDNDVRHRYILDNKRATLPSDINNAGGHACVDVGGISEISVTSVQFYHKPKTALKILSLTE